MLVTPPPAAHLELEERPIGGLGIREGTLVGMLVAAGANLPLAINLSLVYLIVLWISTLPGALVPLLSRTSKIASP